MVIRIQEALPHIVADANYATSENLALLACIYVAFDILSCTVNKSQRYCSPFEKFEGIFLVANNDDAVQIFYRSLS